MSISRYAIASVRKVSKDEISPTAPKESLVAFVGSVPKINHAVCRYHGEAEFTTVR